MPPRGGNPKLSNAKVRAAVAYIMENSRWLREKKGGLAAALGR